jgi:hypothetical protein
MAYDRVFIISSILLLFGAVTAYWIKVVVRPGKTQEIFIE